MRYKIVMCRYLGICMAFATSHDSQFNSIYLAPTILGCQATPMTWGTTPVQHSGNPRAAVWVDGPKRKEVQEYHLVEEIHGRDIPQFRCYHPHKRNPPLSPANYHTEIKKRARDIFFPCLVRTRCRTTTDDSPDSKKHWMNEWHKLVSVM